MQNLNTNIDLSKKTKPLRGINSPPKQEKPAPEVKKFETVDVSSRLNAEKYLDPTLPEKEKPYLSMRTGGQYDAKQDLKDLLENDRKLL